MTITQNMINRAKRFEDTVAFMYLDTAGKITVGTGHMITSATAAAALRFTIVDSGEAASAAKIKAEYALMKQQPAGKPKGFYKQKRTMEMAEPDMGVLLQGDLARAETDLKGIFSAYDGFPVSAQEGLIDMAFNLGKTNFLKFSKFIDACRAKDWAMAAAECDRQGIPDERNDEVRSLFESVAAAPAPHAVVSAALKPLLEAMNHPQHATLFQRGQHVEITLSVGNITASVRSLGGPNSQTVGLSRANEAGVAARGAARHLGPESCRESFALVGFAANNDLHLHEKVPNAGEEATCGAIKKKITRQDEEFTTLEKCTHPSIVFKDEEGTEADRMMSAKLRTALEKLATATATEWTGTKLRVTEAWDENNEHAGNSLHYEGRAADLTTYPIDPSKLGRLGRLAVGAGFDWVWYENVAHIHASVKT